MKQNIQRALTVASNYLLKTDIKCRVMSFNFGGNRPFQGYRRHFAGGAKLLSAKCAVKKVGCLVLNNLRKVDIVQLLYITK